MTVPQPSMRISPNMARKGARLHRDGHVHYAGLVPLYPVEGDTRDQEGSRVMYAVFCWNGAWRCDCPANGACKHIAAVLDARKAGTELDVLERTAAAAGRVMPNAR